MEEIVKALDYDNNNMTLTKAFKEGFALASTLNSISQYTPIQILDMWDRLLKIVMCNEQDCKDCIYKEDVGFYNSCVFGIVSNQEMLLNFIVMLGVEV